MSERKTNTGGREATQGVIPGKFALSVGRPRLPEPAGFTWTKLTDVARIESGHTPSRAKEEYWNGPIPWIGIREATGNHGKTIYETSQSITELGLNNSSTRLLPAETVCLSRTASVGYVVKMGVPMATSQDFVNWVCGPEMSPTYLMYILMAEQDSVRRFSHGTTHQTMYYPEAKALNVLLPPRREQNSIVEVLGALDDKIEANTKLISLVDAHMSLEYTASVLDAGSALPLDEVAEFHNRKRVPLSARAREHRRGDVPYYGANGVFGTVDTAIFDEPLVLVGEDGSVINEDGTPVSQYIWGPAWVNNHAHVLTGKGISTELLFLAIRRTQVATLVTGAVQPKINMGNLKRLALEIPSVDRRGRLEQIVKAETASKRAAIEESRTLAATRDVLLPQLMSGKLRVKDAAKVLEDVGV